jgi:hypothetical protein
MKGKWLHLHVGLEVLLLFVVHIGSGVNPTPYPVGTESFSPGLKRRGRGADHSSPTSVEVRKILVSLSYLSTGITSPFIYMKTTVFRDVTLAVCLILTEKTKFLKDIFEITLIATGRMRWI